MCKQNEQNSCAGYPSNVTTPITLHTLELVSSGYWLKLSDLLNGGLEITKQIDGGAPIKLTLSPLEVEKLSDFLER